ISIHIAFCYKGIHITIIVIVYPYGAIISTRSIVAYIPLVKSEGSISVIDIINAGSNVVAYNSIQMAIVIYVHKIGALGKYILRKRILVIAIVVVGSHKSNAIASRIK